MKSPFVLNEIYPIRNISVKEYKDIIEAEKKNGYRELEYFDEMFHICRIRVREKYFFLLDIYDECVMNTIRYRESLDLSRDYDDKKKLERHIYNLMRKLENEIARSIIIYIQNGGEYLKMFSVSVFSTRDYNLGWVNMEGDNG